MHAVMSCHLGNQPSNGAQDQIRVHEEAMVRKDKLWKALRSTTAVQMQLCVSNDPGGSILIRAINRELEVLLACNPVSLAEKRRWFTWSFQSNKTGPSWCYM